MDISLSLDRMLFSCPETDSSDYMSFPGVDDDAFNCMESMISDRSGIYVFPYLCTNMCEETYITVYVWDYLNYPEPYKRFVICEGQQMIAEEERDYLAYAGIVRTCETDWNSRFVSQVKDAFPDWHVSDYGANQIGIMMEHIYYASHRSGPKETLYKAGLGYIAYHLDDIASYNLIGTSPTEIIGHDLSLKMLRFINEHRFVSCLSSPEAVTKFKNAYRLCLSHVGKKKITKAQWRYLEEICAPDGNGLREGFNEKIFNFLEDCCPNEVLAYKTFYRIRSRISENCKLRIPQPEDIFDMLYKLDCVLDYDDDAETLDERLREQKEKLKLEYSFGQFVVIVPECVEDFVDEAMAQHNCLLTFVEECAYGYRTVIFIRRKECVDRSYVTVDISNGHVGQVFARFNNYPEVEVYEFLELYSQIFGLDYDPCKLTGYDEFKDAEHRRSVREYTKKFNRKRRAARQRIKRQTMVMEGQISMFEKYPELFGEHKAPEDIFELLADFEELPAGFY